MTITARTPARAFRETAGSALRWITAFDPFGPYTPSVDSR
jgi:hypothetical protein